MRRLVFVEQRPVTGRILPIEGAMTIGREGCEIVLADPEVSRRHAALTLADEGPAIEDLGSTNGTWVNGALVDGPTTLKEGDTVELGNTLWRVESPGATTQIGARPGA